MEILSNIKYGYCFTFNTIHPECKHCCCECDNKCANICHTAKVWHEKRYCGNYQNTVEFNNKLLKQLQLIQQKVNDMKKK
jgi:hypothetical protein